MKKHKKLKIIASVISFLCVTVIGYCLGCTAVYAQDTQSWLADFLNPVFDIELTNGNVVFNKTKEREQINTNINMAKTEEYSLYDRFGPDVSFFCYSGEIKIQTGIVDKIYTFIATGEDLSISAIADILKSDSRNVNNLVYEGRVDICNSQQDPRYVAWQNRMGLGGNVSLANFYLGFAKWLEDIEAFFISDQISTVLVGFVVDKLDNDELFEQLKPVIGTLVAILVAFCIFRIAGMAIKFIRGNQVGFLQIIAKVGYALLACAIIWLFASAPFSLVPILEKLIEIKQEIVNETVDNNMLTNGVIKGSDNQIEAMLWFINIYDPWCYGTFNRSYYEMYTQYAEDNDEMIADPHGVAAAYDISDDNVWDDWSDGSLRYSCKYIVGDIRVPRGNKVYVRNWAALGYSMQSIYHINAIEGGNNKATWPNAFTTPYNPNIYCDDFRYIDGILNISEEYDHAGHRTGNIASSGPNAPRAYSTANTIAGAWLAIYRVIILNIPLMLFAIRIVIYVVEMIFFAIMLVWNSIQYLVRFDEGPFQQAVRNFVDILLKWILMNVMLLFALGLYAFTYSTFVGNIAYLVMCIVLWIEAPALTRKEREVQGVVNKKLKEIGGWAKDKVTGNGYKGKKKKSAGKWDDDEDENESESEETTNASGTSENFNYEDAEDHDEAEAAEGEEGAEGTPEAAESEGAESEGGAPAPEGEPEVQKEESESEDEEDTRDSGDDGEDLAPGHYEPGQYYNKDAEIEKYGQEFVDDLNQARRDKAKAAEGNDDYSADDFNDNDKRAEVHKNEK